mmetsp:Transcript_30218/g.65183  ORF Transcript_30218/g.65183 Transcript_30218/m.65183 type:complete len:235 (+) Transcript_30218:226-930(+)
MKTEPPSPRAMRVSSSTYVLSCHVCAESASIASCGSGSCCSRLLTWPNRPLAADWSGPSAPLSGARSRDWPITLRSLGRSRSAINCGVTMPPLVRRSCSRLGLRTSNDAVVDSDVRVNGTDRRTLFSTVAMPASMRWVTSPMSTSGSLLSASTVISSLFDVYTSFQSPDSFSRTSVGLGTGFCASIWLMSSLISARTSLRALRPRSVPYSESSSAALRSDSDMLESSMPIATAS